MKIHDDADRRRMMISDDDDNKLRKVEENSGRKVEENTYQINPFPTLIEPDNARLQILSKQKSRAFP